MNPDNNLWMVRAGKGAYLVEKFIEKSIVAIGWNELGELPNDITGEDLKERLRKSYPNYSRERINNHAGQIIRFVNEFQIGDGVLTYDSSRRIYHLGVFSSEYRYDPTFEFHHVRTVKWHNEIHRDTLSNKVNNSLGSISTIFNIPPDIKKEILRVLNLNEPIPIDEEEEDQQLEEIKESFEDNALEFIKDKVQKLGWEEMEEIVAGLLRAMGYKTLVSPKGRDRGKDILASPDGLGLEQPRIKVEVKHRAGSVGAPEIRSFTGGLSQRDSALYVSTGGFTLEGKYEADRSNVPLKLMDIDLLVRMIIQHYDTFDSDTRALLPLRKVYWPV